VNGQDEMSVMTPTTSHCCEKMVYYLDYGETALNYDERFREYGIDVLKRFGGGQIVIDYCPWCGSRLPENLSDEWFDRLESMGLEPDDPKVPEEMKTDAWWISEGL
jgi:hypothetical protein